MFDGAPGRGDDEVGQEARQGEGQGGLFLMVLRRLRAFSRSRRRRQISAPACFGRVAGLLGLRLSRPRCAPAATDSAHPRPYLRQLSWMLARIAGT